MADDKALRSYRSQDRHPPVAEPSRPRNPAKSSDPLAELARLIGQSDPFAELGRNSQGAPPQQGNYSHPDLYPAAGGYDPDERWAAEPPRDRRKVAYPPAPDFDDFAPNERHAAPAAYARSVPTGRSSPRYADPAADQREQAPQIPLRYPNEVVRDDHPHAGDGREHPHAGDDHEEYELADGPLEPDDEAMYDDAPRKRRRGGLATALALIGCAMLGTAGAYAYRSYSSHPAAHNSPPVITADSSTPTKIVPSTAGNSQSGKVSQERVAQAGREQVVSKQEEPVAIKEFGTQTAPRVVLPSPVAPIAPSSPTVTLSPVPPPQPAPGAAGASTEPRKVRTVVIRPEGADPSARPVGAAPAAQPTPTTRSTTPPASRATPPARDGNSPISLNPQAPAAEPVAQPRTRTAVAPADQSPAEATAGFLVQLSSQKTESDALASFRSLQTKFPNELGGRKPLVRRVDLGSKGVYYRTHVGPFPSAQEASRFCASYKAAGGQCVVPSN